MSTATVTTTTAAEAAAAASAEALPKMNPSSSSSSSYLPLVVSWKHGMARKASNSNISVWLDLALTLDGRDKLTKLLQYMSRFLAWYYASMGTAKYCSTHAAAAAAERFGNLKVALTNSRKAFRLGRTLMELQKVYGMNLVQTILGRFWQQGPSPSLSTTNTNNMITLIGTAMKCLGLAGFWAGDNVNFLSQSGFLDDYQITGTHQRLQQRKRLATRAGIFANRSYFCGAVAGLVVNARAYLCHCRESQERLQQIQMTTTTTEMKDDNNQNDNNNADLLLFQKVLDEAQEKQFVLFVALLKSCCDTLAFSNNPGVDLWEKYITRDGRKLNEGIHCVAGMLSACAVLYNNFPNNNNIKK